MKMRRGWYIVWPDGTKWLEDCATCVRGPIAPGSVRVPIRIVGNGRSECGGCTNGKR